MTESQDPLCINCWSGPRCVSTSLMYAWAQRNDTQVLDEPLYASYLHITGAERPYSQQVMESQDPDGNRVVRDVLLGPRQSKVLYAKHMAKHRVGVEGGLMRRAKHVLLVREPLALLQSFSEVLPPSLHETCYPALCEIYSELRSMGRPPPVVLSDDLVRDPEGMLRALCVALELPFDPGMLRWQAGPKPYDGVWAPWWYQRTHSATGFEPPSATDAASRPRPRLPPSLRPLLQECWPLWEMLSQHALRPLAPHPTHSSAPQLGSPPPEVAACPAGGPEQEGAGRSPGGAQHAEPGGTHAYRPDPRNDDVMIGMRDGVTGRFRLVWRPQAKVSVLDSGFMLGDGVWEGLRLHRGVVLFASQHLERLYEGAKAIDMDIDLTPAKLLRLVYDTVDGNGMGQESGVHIRLMVTRGLKSTPYQNPRVTLGGATVVIIPEYKQAAEGPKARGLRLFTCHVRRGAADVQDPSWNSHSKLNCIAACVQANHAGADEALMLDPNGFVATCNSTNFFVVRKGEVWAPTTKYQLHGITRQTTLDLCRGNGIPVRELDFSLTKVYSADEAFVTGTFGGQISVREVDGRVIGLGAGAGPVTAKLQSLYRGLCDTESEKGRQAL